MFEIFLIIIILLFLASLFLYIRMRKNYDNTEKDLKKKQRKKEGRLDDGGTYKMKDHLALALLEREKILNTNGLLPGANSSMCYGIDGKNIKGCKCHPTCKTCGYGKDPKGMNQCLTCINGSDVNSLYTNGAGWCSIERSKEPSMIKENTGQNLECNQKILQLCGLKNKYDNNGDFSGWDECLENNEMELLIHGCQFDKDYNIEAAEPYKCQECIRIYNPNSDNKNIGAQKCCSGGKNCYMRRCSVSQTSSDQNSGAVINTGNDVNRIQFTHKYIFTTSEISENNTNTDTRTIKVTFKFKKDIPPKSKITISNLLGVAEPLTNPFLKIENINIDGETNTTANGEEKEIYFGGTTLNPMTSNQGSWNHTTGILILTVSDDKTIKSDTEVEFSVDMTLKATREAVVPKINIVSGDKKFIVLSNQNNQNPIFAPLTSGAPPGGQQ